MTGMHAAAWPVDGMLSVAWRCHGTNAVLAYHVTHPVQVAGGCEKLPS